MAKLPNWWQFCVIVMVCTGCAIAFMMATAKNPSADDFWRAMGTAFLTIGGSAGLARFFNKKSESDAGGD